VIEAPEKTKESQRKQRRFLILLLKHKGVWWIICKSL